MQDYGKWLVACALVAGFGILTTMAAAQAERWQPLRQDVEINSGLTVIAVGDYVVDNCPDIRERRLTAFNYAMGLANRARDLGFSRSEIEAFVDDETEKARVRAQAQAWIAQQGASVEDPASLCQLARDEISAGSTIGRLLQER